MQTNLTIPTFGDTRLPLRFWVKVHVLDNGCWEWMACRDRKGYGRFQMGKHKLLYAHRFAYEMLVGSIPNSLESDHLCRNHSCVYPAHIEPVTGSANVQRGAGTKLRATDIPVIRALRGRVRQVELAERFGVSRAQIGHVQRGESWSHLTLAPS